MGNVNPAATLSSKVVWTSMVGKGRIFHMGLLGSVG